MTKIERLKLRFASGMSEGRISSDEWELEFLPMILDAERYRWLRANPVQPWVSFKFVTNYPDGVLPHNMAPWIDAAIDSARTPTKE